jgi:hypothetical protein
VGDDTDNKQICENITYWISVMKKNKTGKGGCGVGLGEVWMK